MSETDKAIKEKEVDSKFIETVLTALKLFDEDLKAKKSKAKEI